MVTYGDVWRLKGLLAALVAEGDVARMAVCRSQEHERLQHQLHQLSRVSVCTYVLVKPVN
jgi:hypothetical protein